MSSEKTENIGAAEATERESSTSSAIVSTESSQASSMSIKSIFSKIKGRSREEFLENTSIILLVLSTALVSIGIFMGSFIDGAAYIGLAGAALFIPGIIIFLASQFMEDFKRLD